MKRPVEFYSEGAKLSGDVYTPDGLSPGEKRAAVVLCHGYTGVKDLYLPDAAKYLNDAGYVAMTFDYKGWGKSEGTRSRLAPYGRVYDVQAAMTFLAIQPETDPDKMGLYGVSYGGSTVSWVGAIDPRAKCVVGVMGVGNGTRWMRSVRRPDEWFDLVERSNADRDRRVMTGESEMAGRSEILLLDRRSAELAAASRRNNPSAVDSLPMEYVDDTIGFNPEWIVDKISPRAVMFITTEDDRAVPPEESEQLFDHAREPKRLVKLRGYSHYELYSEPALREVMAAALDWYREHIPA